MAKDCRASIAPLSHLEAADAGQRDGHLLGGLRGRLHRNLNLARRHHVQHARVNVHLRSSTSKERDWTVMVSLALRTTKVTDSSCFLCVKTGVGVNSTPAL